MVQKASVDKDITLWRCYQVFNLQQIHNIKEHTGDMTLRREDNLKSLPIALLRV